MSAGDLDWIIATLSAAGGTLSAAALESALAVQADGTAAAMWARVAVAPQVTRLANGDVTLVKQRVQGANFRLTPDAQDLAQGALRLGAGELAVALACAPAAAGPDREVSWRPVDEQAGPARRTRLARGNDGEGWMLPGLDKWLLDVGFEAGDDLIVHVRDLETPLLVLDRCARYDREEGVLARRNARVLEAAYAALVSETWEGAGASSDPPGSWISFEHLVKLVVGRYDYRRGLPPDACSARLLARDPRFLVSADGREVRMAHFHSDSAAYRLLSRLSTPESALGVFLEEYPPRGQADHDRALTRIRELWQDAPRVELGGRSPAQDAEFAAKIVPFPGSHG